MSPRLHFVIEPIFLTCIELLMKSNHNLKDAINGNFVIQFYKNKNQLKSKHTNIASIEILMS